MAIKALNLFIFPSLASPPGILPPRRLHRLPTQLSSYPASGFSIRFPCFSIHPLQCLECGIPSGPAGNPPTRRMSIPIYTYVHHIASAPGGAPRSFVFALPLFLSGCRHLLCSWCIGSGKKWEPPAVPMPLSLMKWPMNCSPKD